jgi:hypothetical protein
MEGAREMSLLGGSVSFLLVGLAVGWLAAWVRHLQIKVQCLEAKFDALNYYIEATRHRDVFPEEIDR